MARKVLVTGGTGFLGSRLVRCLLARGEGVKVLARPGASRRALRGLDVEVIDGDILMEGSVFAALAGCDRLVHCAAVYTLWAPDPAAVHRGAIDGTLAVLRAARARRIDRVVYTSTAYAVGGRAEPEPLDEEAPWIEPSGPVYALAKRRAEEAAMDYATRTGLPIVTVNPCAIFGPGDTRPTPSGQSLLDVLSAPVIPGIGLMAPRAPGGINVVDVDDVALGHALALERGREGQRYILGGDNVALAEWVETVASLAGLPKPALAVSRTSALVASALLSLAGTLTGWTPPLSLDTVRGSFGMYYYARTDKAQRELGYTARPARETLARSVRSLVDTGLVPRAVQRRMRLAPTVLAAG